MALMFPSGGSIEMGPAKSECHEKSCRGFIVSDTISDWSAHSKAEGFLNLAGEAFGKLKDFRRPFRTGSIFQMTFATTPGQSRLAFWECADTSALWTRRHVAALQIDVK